MGGTAGTAGAGMGAGGMPTTSERVGDLSRSYANPYNTLVGSGSIGASDPDMVTTLYGRQWLALRGSLRGGFLVTM
jgi:hypothetical protein